MESPFSEHYSRLTCQGNLEPKAMVSILLCDSCSCAFSYELKYLNAEAMMSILFGIHATVGFAYRIRIVFVWKTPQWYGSQLIIKS